MANSATHLIPSFYTFGRDYHGVLHDRIQTVMNELGIPFHAGVDNHPHDERLAAVLAGIGFFGKNQLIIHPTLGNLSFSRHGVFGYKHQRRNHRTDPR
ncbi:MAG: hypothetical protein MZU97_21100 [Bacillus subtilis]|nr:hypothetical protein [Bacillus subtilis]